MTDVGATATGTRHLSRLLPRPARPRRPANSRRRCSAASAAPTRCPLAEHDVCCGFGGLFAVKMADISSAMLERKLDAIEESGRRHGRRHRRELRDAHGRAACTAAASPIRVRHLADLLADRGCRQP